MRLLVRIWAHGALLVLGVIAMVIGLRFGLREVDEAFVLRRAPVLAVAAGEHLLAHPTTLAAELDRLAAETPFAASVYDGAGHLLGAARTPLPVDGGRVVVRGADRTVVLGLPAPPSLPIHALALAGCALVLGFVFVAWPLTTAIARPLERLRAHVRRLGDGDLAARTHSTRRDEIGELARAFDTMAAQLQRLRGAERQLLGDVSHELRTPLARMRVVLDLADDAEPERVRRYLGEVATDLAELERLIDDIIATTKLAHADTWDEARPPLRLATIAIAAPIEAALARFRERWPARALVGPAALPDVRVVADAALVRRVLDNLLDNARVHADTDAPIEVAAAVVGDRVRVEVHDRGAGIDPADQPRVFTPFFRADRSRARESGGVGLGLALARRILEAHGGELGFRSEPHVETCFWFELPIATRG